MEEYPNLCPFCGATEPVVAPIVSPSRFSAWVECSSCFGKGPSIYGSQLDSFTPGKNSELAVSAWNKRSVPDLREHSEMLLERARKAEALVKEMAGSKARVVRTAGNCFWARPEKQPMRSCRVVEANDYETLLAAAEMALRSLGECREMLGVFEDNGGHDGLQGKGYLATLNHLYEARKALGEAIGAG